MVEKDAANVSDNDLDAWINALNFKKSKTRYEEKKLDKFIRMRRQRQDQSKLIFINQSQHEKQMEKGRKFRNDQKKVAISYNSKVQKKTLRKSEQFMLSTSNKLGKSILRKSILDKSELCDFKEPLSAKKMDVNKVEEPFSYNNSFGESDISCDKEQFLPKDSNIFVGKSKLQVPFDMYDIKIAKQEIYHPNMLDAGDINGINENNTLKSKKKVSFKNMFDTCDIVDNKEQFLPKECYVKISKLEASWLNVRDIGDICDEQFLTSESNTTKPKPKVPFQKMLHTTDLLDDKEQYQLKESNIKKSKQEISCLNVLDKDDNCDEEQFLTNESNTMKAKLKVSFINMFDTSDNSDNKEQLLTTENIKKNLIAFDVNTEFDDRQKYPQQISFKNMFDTRDLFDDKEHYLPQEGNIKKSKEDILCSNVLDKDEICDEEQFVRKVNDTIKAKHKESFINMFNTSDNSDSKEQLLETGNKMNIVASDANSEFDDRQKHPQQISFKNMFDKRDLFDKEHDLPKEGNLQKFKQEISCSNVLDKDDICDEEQFVTKESNTIKAKPKESSINMFNTGENSDSKEQLKATGNNKKNIVVFDANFEFDDRQKHPQQISFKNMFDKGDLFDDKEHYLPKEGNIKKSKQDISCSNVLGKDDNCDEEQFVTKENITIKAKQKEFFINLFDTSDNSDSKEQLLETGNNKKNVVTFDANSEFDDRQKHPQQISFKNMFDKRDLFDDKEHYLPKEGKLQKFKQEISCSNVLDKHDICDEEQFLTNESNTIKSNQKECFINLFDTSDNSHSKEQLISTGNNEKKIKGELAHTNVNTNTEFDIRQKSPQQTTFDQIDLFDDKEQYLLKKNEQYIPKESNIKKSHVNVVGAGEIFEKQFLTNGTNKNKSEQGLSHSNVFDINSEFDNNKKCPQEISFINMFDETNTRLSKQNGNNKNKPKIEMDRNIFDGQKSAQQTSFKNMFDTRDVVDDKKQYLSKESKLKKVKQEISCLNVIDTGEICDTQFLKKESSAMKSKQNVSFINMFDTSDNSISKEQCLTNGTNEKSDDFYTGLQEVPIKESQIPIAKTGSAFVKKLRSEEIKKENKCSLNLNETDGQELMPYVSNEKNTLNRMGKSVDKATNLDNKSYNSVACKKEIETDISKFKKHKRTSTYYCNQFVATCDYKTEYNRHFEDHLEFKHSKSEQTNYPYSCTQCSFKSNRQGTFKSHKEVKHEGICYVCDKCTYITKYKQRLKDHIGSKHEGVKYSCDQCPVQVMHRKSLRRHIEFNHAKTRIENQTNFYFCDKCDYKAKRSSQLTEHIKFKHEKIQVNCDKCDYKSRNRTSMHHHKKSKHEGIEYSCEQCSHKFSLKRSLEAHMKFKHQGVRYYCEKCAHSYRDKIRLREHMKSLHEGVWNECDQCTFKTIRKSNLTQHKQVKHEGIQYTCDQCDFTNKYKKYLNDHKKYKHDGIIKDITYSCDQCEFKTTNSGNLSRHIQIKHKGVIFACEQCDFTAKQKVSLKAHSYKHSGTFRYSCNLCSFKGNDKGNLNKHMKSKH